MLTLDEIRVYLRVDGSEEDEWLLELIEVSHIYIDSMVGKAYKVDENAVRLASLLQRYLIQTMYEERSINVPSNTKENRIVSSILDKLSNC
jgi:uncharacterized phage protein (predicted DNA packaging)|nr:MAG TPA: head tail connector [Caudoviricetes sp.]